MINDIEVLYHSSIKISKNKIIYIDPFKIDNEYHDADFIFITHDHFDHYSEDDIYKVAKENTIIIVPESLLAKVIKIGILNENIVAVKPSEQRIVNGIKFETVVAYNKTKLFHPKKNKWLGYIIEIDEIRYYIAGDTDVTEENKKVNCDVAFVPVGGIYTMNAKEAAYLVNEIKPKIAVPIHYGSIVGKKEDATKFIKLLDNNIKGIILMK